MQEYNEKFLFISQFIKYSIKYNCCWATGSKLTVDQGHGPDRRSLIQHVSSQVPAHDHQVVTQVSQHVPVVPVQQHVAKQRSMRSIIGKAGKCDFKCADTDNAICGFNGRCHRQFDNQCELSAHNCLNAHK
ncbi:hypothetical protein DOY81_012405, partial [Sarcophaga bullata]